MKRLAKKLRKLPEKRTVFLSLQRRDSKKSRWSGYSATRRRKEWYQGKGAVINKLFLHLVVGDDTRWYAGAMIKTTEKLNRLWTNYQHENSVYRHQSLRRPITRDVVLRQALNVYEGRSHERIATYHYDIEQSYKEAVDCIFFNMRLVRELVFEEVRTREYPHCPSRRTCIWLMPDDLSAVKAWRSSLPEGQHRLFRVLAKGKIHCANPKYLEGGSLGISFWRELAVNYWSGKDIHEKRKEILFEGELKVVEQMDWRPA